MKKPAYGFTIVELLITIVVVAVIAAVTVVGYTGFQDRARRSKMDSDIKTIVNAIQLARINNAQNLRYITGYTYTAGPCVSHPSGTNLAALPNNDPCITTYLSSLNAISAASGVQLGDVRDPWGRPYFIDENESETGPSYCTKDTVAAFRVPFVTGYGIYSGMPLYNVPLGGFTGCV